MTTLQTVGIGAGRDYATLTDFRNWVIYQDLVGQDKNVLALIYEDQTATILDFTHNDLSKIDVSHGVVIRPAAGLSFSEIAGAGGVITTPTAGIKVTINSMEYFAFKLGSAYAFEDTWFQTGTQYNGSEGSFLLNSYFYNDGLRRCVLAGSNALGPLLKMGGPAFAGSVTDCLIIGTGSAACSVVELGHGVHCSGTTIVSEDQTKVGLKVTVDFNSTSPRLSSNIVLGGLVMDMPESFQSADAAASGANYYSGSYLKTGSQSVPVGMWTKDVNVAASIESVPTDLRPKLGGIYVGAALASQASTQDINHKNRGTSPDVGALQRSVAAPLPSGAFTGTVVTGQKVVASGTTTNGPTSATAVLAVGTTPSGAVAYGPVTVTLSAGAFTVTFDDLMAGNYGAITVSLVNGGGTAQISNEVVFSVIGIDGQPQAANSGLGG